MKKDVQFFFSPEHEKYFRDFETFPMSKIKNPVRKLKLFNISQFNFVNL